jgi:hypothetical protein
VLSMQYVLLCSYFPVILSGFCVLVTACTMCVAVLFKGGRKVDCCGCAALHGFTQERSVAPNVRQMYNV